jgi:hypothetical protein
VLAHDDGPKDRHHRQHARRDRQQQAEAEEEQRDCPKLVAGQRANDAVAVIAMWHDLRYRMPALVFARSGRGYCSRWHKHRHWRATLALIK